MSSRNSIFPNRIAEQANVFLVGFFVNSLKSSTITVHLFSANAHSVYDVLQTFVAEQVAISVPTHWNEPKTFQDVPNPGHPKNAKVDTRIFVVPLRFVFSRKFWKFVIAFIFWRRIFLANSPGTEIFTYCLFSGPGLQTRNMERFFLHEKIRTFGQLFSWWY